MNRGDLAPGAVEAGLARCARDERLAFEMPRRTNEEWAARAERLGEVWTRRAHWWAVLGRWAYKQDLPDVLARAAITAAAGAHDHARSWREMAGDWRRRSGSGCCEVVDGCGCVGSDQVGVA